MSDTQRVHQPLSSPSSELSFTYTATTAPSVISEPFVEDMGDFPPLPGPPAVQTNNGPPRHPNHYMQEGMIEIQLKDFAYRGPEYVFTRNSDWFKEQLRTNTTGILIIDDPTVTSADFDCLWSIMFPAEIGGCGVSTAADWSAILFLADKWRFSALRARAAAALRPLAGAAERIVLGRMYGLAEWFPDAFVEVCTAPRPLARVDARKMEMDDVVGISHAREAIRLPRALQDPKEIRAVVARICCPDADVGEGGADDGKMPHAEDGGASQDVVVANTLEPTDTERDASNSLADPSQPVDGCLVKITAALETWKQQHRTDPWQRRKQDLPTPHAEILAALNGSDRTLLTLQRTVALLISDGIRKLAWPQPYMEGRSSSWETSFPLILARLCKDMSLDFVAAINGETLAGPALARRVVDEQCRRTFSTLHELIPGEQEAQLTTRQGKSLAILLYLRDQGLLSDENMRHCVSQLLNLPPKPTLPQVENVIGFFSAFFSPRLDKAPLVEIVDTIFERLALLRFDPEYENVHAEIMTLQARRERKWV